MHRPVIYRSTAGSRLLLCLVLFPIVGVPAEFEPSVRVGLTHTDNLFLDAEDPVSELAFRFEPALRFSHESKRLNVDADYRYQSFWYRDLGERSSFDQYNLDIEGALVPDILFIGVGGDRIQSITDSSFNIPPGNLPITNNLVDRDEYYAQPRLQMPLGQFGVLQAQYRYSEVDFGGEGLLSSDNQNAYLSFDNYQRGRGASLALNYEWRDTEYEDGVPWRFARAMAEVGFWVTGKMRLFGGAGYESPWDEPENDSLEAEVWELGFAYESGGRTSAEFAIGDRSFGETWRGSLNFDFNTVNMTFSYSETPTTQAQQRFRAPETGGSETLPTENLVVAGGTDRFIARRLDWITRIELSKTTLSLNVFSSDWTDRTSAAGDPLPDENSAGAILSLEYALGVKTSVRLTGSYSTREIARIVGGVPAGLDEREITRYLAALNYQLGARTTASLEYRYDKEQPVSSSAVGGFRANSVTLYVNWAY